MSINPLNNIHTFVFIIDTVYRVVENELRIIISVNLRRPVFTVYFFKVFKLVTVGRGNLLYYTQSSDLPSDGG